MNDRAIVAGRFCVIRRWHRVRVHLETPASSLAARDPPLSSTIQHLAVSSMLAKGRTDYVLHSRKETNNARCRSLVWSTLATRRPSSASQQSALTRHFVNINGYDNRFSNMLRTTLDVIPPFLPTVAVMESTRDEKELLSVRTWVYQTSYRISTPSLQMMILGIKVLLDL